MLAAALSGCCAPEPVVPGTLHADTLEERRLEVEADLPPGFAAVVAPPFVVVGEGSRAQVRADAEELVTPVVRSLRSAFFDREPSPVQSVWLFGSEASYRTHVNVVFGHHARTPYGYYAPCDDALLVNLGLGTGTVAHELVHVFMAVNFPGAPRWFDEGLASLHEQTERRPDGTLRGVVNWRLRTLQLAFESAGGPPLEEITSTSRSAFYDEERRDLHYAASRYVLHHLQERGLLARYYRRFRERHGGDDPTGYATLGEVLGVGDVEAWYRGTFRAWVLALEYRVRT